MGNTIRPHITRWSRRRGVPRALGTSPVRDILSEGWKWEFMQNAELPKIGRGTNQGLSSAGRAAMRPAGLLVFALFLLFLFVYLRLFRNALVDDAYITLDYARTLLGAGTWGLRPGLPANSATSPLNVILLAAVGLLFGATPNAAIWLALLCYAGMAVTLERISLNLFQTFAFGRIATVAFLLNPLLISTLGMESILFAALLVLAVHCYISTRWRWLGFVVGMLSITRPDGLLYALIFMFFLPQGRTRQRYVGAFLVSSAPWYLFSWIHLGSFIPDTFFIKLGMASWGASSYLSGIGMYLQRFPLEASLSFIFLPLLSAVAFKPIRDMPVLRLLISLGLARFLGYSALNARPFHWYYATEIDIAILFGSLSLGTLYKRAQPGSRFQAAVRSTAAAYLLVPCLGMSLLLARVGFKLDEMPIHANWGTAAQYEQVATWLEAHAGGKAVHAAAEIGTVTYYCPACYLLDLFSDRRWLVKSVDDQRSQPGIAGAVYRANFLFLRDGPELPPYAFVLTGYEDRRQEGKPVLMEWELSTKWAPKGLMTFTTY